MIKKDFFDIYARSIKQSIRTTMPAKIISFDKNKMTATVQPLFLQKEDSGGVVKMGVLEDLPVLQHRMSFVNADGVNSTQVFGIVYKPGDTVFISVCDRNMDDFQKGFFAPNSSRLFSVHDAVVIGGYQLS